MKVLLTGATGFIGRQVLNQLQKEEVEVVVLGRARPLGYLGEYIECDLLQQEPSEQLIQSVGASHLIHLAWYAEHGAYWTSPVNLRWVEATVRLSEAFCSTGGKQMVLAGTCAEYDWSYRYCTETKTPLNPNSLYGTAKDATRRLVAAICKQNQVNFAWGRIFFPYGPGEDRRRLIPSLIDVFDGKRAPFAVSANAYRDFIHVNDVASGFLALLQSDCVGEFNICSGKPISIAEVVNILAKLRKGDPNLVLGISNERLEEHEMVVGENARLKKIGWKPKHCIGEV
jgi:nucleoside-diphosphate-sugar epimerase